MKNTFEANKVGLAFGGVLGLWHLVWSILVAVGWAQPLFDWILHLHMMQLPVKVLPFVLSTAVTLVVVTSLIGYVVGYVFATVWNSVQK